jgi:hypothetical protein
MNERIRELVKQAGGEFWQRIESDGVLNKEAYITFDPPQSLEKFAELIVKECTNVIEGGRFLHDQAPTALFAKECSGAIKRHFGVKE